jgi:hypothetical protein
VSKNDYVFTPINFRVKQKASILKALNAAVCRLFTSRCPEFVQRTCGGTAGSLAEELKSICREHAPVALVVKISAETNPGAALSLVNARGRRLN